MKIIKSTLINNISKYDVVLLPMGINNAMSQGFLYEVALNFPQVKESENNTPYGNKNKYGTVHCTVVNNITFAACYIHNGGHKKNPDGSFLNYEYLSKCLEIIDNNFKEKKIASIIMGCNPEDGNGDREKILSLFEPYDIDIYDFVQENTKLNTYKKLCENYRRFKHKEITYEEYKAIKEEIKKN